MEQIREFIENSQTTLHIPKLENIGVIDILEITIISWMVYHILVWIRNTRAWFLMRGVVSIMVMLVIAVLLEMNTILWIAQNVVYVAVFAFIVVLQPELRKALETLGKKSFIKTFLPVDFGRTEEGLFSDHTIREIAKAAVEMGKVKTGALIVVGQDDNLSEFESTGIILDGIVSSQLLINIFEHNTPLHDGAVIIRGNRITAATCYLPLSDNQRLSKDLGTRHRAGVGISEVTDALTIIVSEETGKISIAYQGTLHRGLRGEDIERHLSGIQNKPVEDTNKRKLFKSKGKQVSGKKQS